MLILIYYEEQWIAKKKVPKIKLMIRKAAIDWAKRELFPLNQIIENVLRFCINA